MKNKALRLCLLLAVTLTVLLCSCTALADSANGALDLVILLDNSGSMYRNSLGNDAESYRYDAASIMLNMCEATGSRAVVYEFSGVKEINAIPRGETELKSIDLDQNGGWDSDSYRSLLTEKLTQRARDTYMQDHEGYTPLGAALAKAVEVLDEGAADRGERQPIILILADGDDTNEEAVRREALKNCLEKGYKIYTVLLGDAIDHRDTLQDMAARTGGRYFELSDASELPKYFSQVFADQTGAELTSDKVQATRVSGNRWQVAVTVPNRSVQECNIMIPTSGLSNITLSRPNGTAVSPKLDKKIFYFEVGGISNLAQKDESRFVQYKIMQPNEEGSELGEWLLTFDAEDEEAAKKVSVTVVFNYNLSLKNCGAESISVGKEDQSVITAKFFTPDGTASEDDMLYRSQDGDPAIICKAYLLTSPDGELEEKRSLTFAADQIAREFELKFRFNDFENTNHKSGQYYLVLKAEGDGLNRVSAPIAYTVSNAAPQSNNLSPITLTIEDPNRGLDVPDERQIALTDFLADPDGIDDLDLSSLRVESEDTSIVKAEVVTAENGDPAASFLTLKTTGKAGTANITVTVRDIENEPASVTIPVEVKSLMACLNEDYELQFSCQTPGDENGRYQRGTTVQLMAEYKLMSQNPAYPIEQYSPEIRLQQVFADGTRENLSSSEVTLEGEGGDYTYDALLYVNGNLLTSQQLQLSTGNVPPAAREESNWTPDAASIGCEKFPDTLLGHKNTEPWLVRFEDMFYDANEADQLTYAYRVEDGDSVQVQENVENGVLVGLTLIPQAEGVTHIALIATDDSMEKASYSQVYTVTVKDQNKITIRNCLLILAALVVLFILFKVIYAAVRPKFNNAALQVFINHVPQKTYPLSHNLKKESMSKYTLPAHQFTGSMASALEIRPVKEGAQIIVKKAAQLRSAEVKMNNTKLGTKTKKAILRMNSGELNATVNGETMSWKLVPTAAKSVRPAQPSGSAAKPASGRSSVPNRY